MKRLLVVSVLVFAVQSLFGQNNYAQNQELLQNISLYTELAKQNNYAEALPYWRYVYQNAPDFKKSTYQYGEKIFEGLYQQTNQKGYLDSLLFVFDERIKYFGEEGYVLGRKGLAQYRYANNDVNMLKAAFNNMMRSQELEKNRTDARCVNAAFVLACNFVGIDELEKSEFVDLYINLSDFCDKQSKSGSRSSSAYASVMSNLDEIFFSSGYADCLTLTNIFSEQYAEVENNLDELREMAVLLRRQECTDYDLYTKVSEQIYKLSPDADAAYGLARRFLQSSEIDKAEHYFNEAIAKSTVPEDKSKYLLSLAQISMSQKDFPQVKKYVQEALKLTPKNGDAYIILGKAYAFASSSFSNDAFENQKVFWVAVDKFIKAKEVDASVKDEANQLIETYSVYFPTREDSFFYGIYAGHSVEVKGWINEITSARFKE